MPKEKFRFLTSWDQYGAWLETLFSPESWVSYPPDQGKQPVLSRSQCQGGPRALIHSLRGLPTPLEGPSAIATLAKQNGGRNSKPPPRSTLRILRSSSIGRLRVAVFLQNTSQMAPLKYSLSCSCDRPSCARDGGYSHLGFPRTVSKTGRRESSSMSNSLSCCPVCLSQSTT